MAAAGPHLSLKSWGPLFQVAGVLGRKALLPTSWSGSSYRGEGEGGGRSGGVSGREEENSLWAALDALWEFAFLQASFGWGHGGNNTSESKIIAPLLLGLYRIVSSPAVETCPKKGDHAFL